MHKPIGHSQNKDDKIGKELAVIHSIMQCVQK